MSTPSLAMIPSGRKAGKVYSVLPTDGTGDFDFTRASEATRVNQNGLIETVGSNVPRIDYTDGGCPSLLLEPSRTNFILKSNDFTGLNGVNVVTPNYSISPQGLSASRVLFTSSNQSINASTSLGIGVVCNFSAYVKGTKGELIKFAAGGVDISHTFNGEWERLSGSATSVSSFWNFNTYGGATARDFLVSGAQLEQGSYATSYIPTNGSAVTRDAEVCNNAGNDQVINSTEGVLYYESKVHSLTGDKAISVSTGSYNDSISIGVYGGVFQSRIRQGGNFIHFISPTGVNLLNNNKIAILYSASSIKIFVNGVLKSNVSGVTYSVILSKISFTRADVTDLYYGEINDLRYYNTALTDQELIALTS